VQFFYKCSECGREFEIKPDLMVCPACSKKQEPDKPLRGILEVNFELQDEDNPEKFNVLDFLPVRAEFFPPIPVGNTPLWHPVNLRKILGFSNLFLKDDTLNPTGSLKDRASYLVAAFAKEHGIKDVVIASTGNAASSMAGVGAAQGLNITIFVPVSAPKAKIIQSLQYGARVIPVDGNYDRAYDLSLEYSKITGSLSRNTAYNPLTIEGKKTVSIEIFKQLGRVPDYIFVPVGDGVILGGLYKGFRDLKRLSLADTIPMVYAVQAEGSDAICKALENGSFEPINARTVADSISVNIPRNGYYAIKQLKDFGGKCVRVNDGEILEAQKLLASTTGLFAEPAASASLAGFIKVKDTLNRDSVVVLLITGNGLKDIDAAKRRLEFPQRAIRNIEEIVR